MTDTPMLLGRGRKRLYLTATGRLKRGATEAFAAAGAAVSRLAPDPKAGVNRNWPCYDPVRNPKRYFKVHRPGLVERAVQAGVYMHQRLRHDPIQGWWRELAPLTRDERLSVRAEVARRVGLRPA